MRCAVLLLLSIVSLAADVPERCVTGINIPTYPRLAQQARIQGTVKIGVTVDDKGVVVKASAIASFGHPMLQEAAVENAKSWKFAPSANTKSSVLIITYEYRIEGQEVLSNDFRCPSVKLDLPSRVEISARPIRLDTNSSE